MEEVTGLTDVDLNQSSVDAGGKEGRGVSGGFEIKLPLKVARTDALNQGIQTRKIVIKTAEERTIGATSTVRSTFALNVNVAQQERKTIRTMLSESVGLNAEDLNTLFSMWFRLSLVVVNLDEGFIGSRIVDQVFGNSQPFHLSPDDILLQPDVGGTPLRLYWSSV